jgi:dextranase
MPYLAIYAASVEFWKKHKSWGMYDENNEPLMFEDFLGLVDPTFGSEWFNHLDNECNEVLEKTNFDGLHIDQYGEPKKAFDSNGKEIDIPKAFVDFINHQKDKNKGDVVFNAVGNWPIEDLAKSKADFMYIEVWDFTPTFKDLMQIAVNARKKSGQRPLVIPIYIKEKDFNNVLLADAVINAAGGTHLEIGDGEKLLSDPYFPKAEYIGDQQLAILRRYWDFVVGYQKVLGPNAVYVDTTAVVDEDIMTISRENENYKAINFINCSNKDKWTEHLEKPQKKENIEVLIPVNGEVTNLLYGSPDDEDYMLKPLEYEIYDGKVKAILPELNYWSMIIIEEN